MGVYVNLSDPTNIVSKMPEGSVIQTVSETNNYTNSFGTTYTDILESLKVVWETSITPKSVNSKFLIMYKLSFTVNAVTTGFRVLQKVGSDSYSIIYKPEELNASSPFAPVDFGSDTVVFRSNSIVPVYSQPSYVLGDSLTFKIQGATSSGTISGFNTTRTGNNGHSEVFIQEIKG